MRYGSEEAGLLSRNFIITNSFDIKIFIYDALKFGVYFLCN